VFDVDASDMFDLAGDLVRGAAKVEAQSEVVVARSTRDTERDAKAFAPVLTGELRDSIHSVIDGLSGEVVATADHAEYVEDGTSVMAPQPYMGPALQRNERGFVAGMERAAGDIL
jgi:HK97 gp10 family phage protein